MSVAQIDASAAKKLIDSQPITIVDVRTPEEFARAKIPGSISLPLTELQDLAEENLPDKNQPVLVYCLSGSRSAVAATILNNLGYSTILNLTHGLMEWRIKQLPLDS